MTVVTPVGKSWAYATPAIMAAALCLMPHRNVSTGDMKIVIEIPSGTKTKPDATEERIAAKNPLPRHAAREFDCLARTVYFEARSDGLEGQLAVARTVLNRTKSGLFPDTICEVVKQPDQFSFVRNSIIPEVDRESKAWRKAVAVAKAAQNGSPTRAAKALFFHAGYVSPNFGRPSIGRIGLHIFYS